MDAIIINAPSPTKNQDRKQDPDMHFTKKGNQYYLGMKIHVGMDRESKTVQSLVTTAVNVNDSQMVENFLHGEEKVVFGDSAYMGKTEVRFPAMQESCFVSALRSFFPSMFRCLQATAAHLAAMRRWVQGFFSPGLSENCPNLVEEFLRGDSAGDEKLEIRGKDDAGGGAGGIQDERSLGFGSGDFGQRFTSVSFRRQSGGIGDSFRRGDIVPSPKGVSGLPEGGVSSSFPSTRVEFPPASEADFSSFFAASSVSLRHSKMQRSSALSVSASRRFLKLTIMDGSNGLFSGR